MVEEKRVKRERDILINKRKFLESQLKVFRNQNQKVDENKDVYGFPHFNLPNDNLYDDDEYDNTKRQKKFTMNKRKYKPCKPGIEICKRKPRLQEEFIVNSKLNNISINCSILFIIIFIFWVIKNK